MYEKRSFLVARFRFGALSLHRVTWSPAPGGANAGSNHFGTWPGVRWDSCCAARQREQHLAACSSGIGSIAI